ncbi:Asp23/Gls24 family envelope stress response protein [Lacticaseibacillus jixiensis]|uniref:Asp23/Gls24 family envelope stress response protein n=1 Tax=Lacticaseibacillus jixiensis TaxID=3231926 RepID=UPI0036F25F0B
MDNKQLHQNTQPQHDETMKQNDDIKKQLQFDDNVVQKIVGKTASEVDGVLDLHGNILSDVADRFRNTDNLKKGVSVSIEDDKRVTVALDAVMKYGTKAPEVFDQVTDAICKNVKEMTGMDVTEVKLVVKDMLTDEEVQAQQDADKDTKQEEAKTPQPQMS